MSLRLRSTNIKVTIFLLRAFLSFLSSILLLRDSGILQRLLKTEWATNQNRPKSGWTSVELEDAMPLLLFLLFAFFVTCLVLLLEIFIHKKLDYRFTIHCDNLFPPRLSRFFRTARSQ